MERVWSDHNPLIFMCNTDKSAAVKKTITCRKIKGIDTQQFKYDIEASELMKDIKHDACDVVDQYNSCLSVILDKHAPATTKEVILRPHSPWYNEQLSTAKKACRKAERAWIKDKLTVHLQILQAERARYNMMCKTEKSRYYQSRGECW